MTDTREGRIDCPVCWGTDCRGGGVKFCLQRDPRPSHVGAILDTYGCMRVVVTHAREFKQHRRHDEVLIVVPDLLVHTPIAWGDIPGLMRRAQMAVKDWVARGRPNEAYAVEAHTMYQLRCLEHSQKSLDLHSIVET